MVGTQYMVERTACPRLGKATGGPEHDPAVQAFQALLSSALNSELIPAGETAPRTQSQTEDSPAPETQVQQRADAPESEKTAKDERPPNDEEIPAELAMAAVPLEVRPVQDTGEQLVEIAAPVTTQVEAPVWNAAMQDRQTDRVVLDETAQIQAIGHSDEVPNIETELIVGERQQTDTTAVSMQVVQSEPEVQSRFDDMVARASRELQGAQAAQTAAEPETEAESPVPPQTQAAPEVQDELSFGERTPPVQRRAVREDEQTDDSPELTAVQPQTEVAESEPLRFEAVERNELFPTPAEQVQQQVLDNLENQRMEFRMQLQPQELGRVDVRMVLEGGKLAVQIIASSAKAAETLRGQTDGLMASMRLANIELDSVQVVQEAQAQEGHMDRGFDMAGGSNQPNDGEAGSGRGAHSAQAEAEQQEIGAPVPEGLLNTAV